MFVRFVTGSVALVADETDVTFNGTNGLNRLPIGHTCTPTIELPSTYLTYPDFARDLTCIIRSDSWVMDAV